MTALRALALACICIVPLAASAQWQWVDKDGRRVFSDKAPPPEVPEKSILRRPGVKATAPAPAEEPAAAASAPAKAVAANQPRVSGKDKALEDKKKQAEAAEAEKKKAQQAEVAKAREDNCARARQGKATFDSGMRIARVNAKGEREILDDNQRAAEVKRLEEVIARDCKTG
ncbi:DUF4124 domain-containing protein [Ramlibacter tataouinensis]|uniref:DUF4124 domain-containing protein n=1 Tax=Ramlibacter tataouinensis TaxID=94132 RepID=UPI0022F3FB1E|nr:DUF4124 domain-containing protein [Ramlibacter tataouinensis]WBY02043.1 DUF4124 domain-containing protein [Ramlibacter tataouinensis]